MLYEVITNEIVAPQNPDSLSDSNLVTNTSELEKGELPATFDELYHYLVNYA